MWPWEHVAFGYVLYSLFVRTRGDRPTDAAAVALVFATQLPDLVDKPLAWWLGVLPAGRSLGHSLLFALPLFAAVGAVCWRAGVVEAAVAFAVGHLSHLAGDVVYPFLVRGHADANFLLYPLLPVASGGTARVLPHLSELVAAFVHFLGTPRGVLYLGFEVTLLSLALVLWATDGVPGIAALWWTRPAPEAGR